jgi:hypothetical protein
MVAIVSRRTLVVRYMAPSTNANSLLNLLTMEHEEPIIRFRLLA